MDRGETPQEAIRREVEEEIKCDFDLFGDFTMEDGGGVQIVKLHKFQIEKVPHHGKHMNFVFFGVCKEFDKKIKETDEKEKLKWFSKQELLKEDMLESVRRSALKALDTIRF
jgi:8-oxo-dGTP pyrophosphatase MutT (NUDIX family)